MHAHDAKARKCCTKFTEGLCREWRSDLELVPLAPRLPYSLTHVCLAFVVQVLEPNLLVACLAHAANWTKSEALVRDHHAKHWHYPQLLCHGREGWI